MCAVKCNAPSIRSLGEQSQAAVSHDVGDHTLVLPLLVGVGSRSLLVMFIF